MRRFQEPQDNPNDTLFDKVIGKVGVTGIIIILTAIVVVRMIIHGFPRAAGNNQSKSAAYNHTSPICGA
jgi:hypothetical protein